MLWRGLCLLAGSACWYAGQRNGFLALLGLGSYGEELLRLCCGEEGRPVYGAPRDTYDRLHRYLLLCFYVMMCRMFPATGRSPVLSQTPLTRTRGCTRVSLRRCALIGECVSYLQVCMLQPGE